MTKQSKVDKICGNVQRVFDPPRIRFLQITTYPANTGIRIGFDYRNNSKVITFSKRYLDNHSDADLADFLDRSKLSRLKQEGDQHLELD